MTIDLIFQVAEVIYRSEKCLKHSGSGTQNGSNLVCDIFPCATKLQRQITTWRFIKLYGIKINFHSVMIFRLWAQDNVWRHQVKKTYFCFCLLFTFSMNSRSSVSMNLPFICLWAVSSPTVHPLRTQLQKTTKLGYFLTEVDNIYFLKHPIFVFYCVGRFTVELFALLHGSTGNMHKLCQYKW